MFAVNKVVRNSVSKRCVSTTVTQTHEETSAQTRELAYEQAREFKEIPRVKTLKALYQLSFTDRKNKLNEVRLTLIDFS